MGYYYLVPLFSLLLIIPTIADPDPLQDFCVADTSASVSSIFVNGHPCINPTHASVEDFKTSVLRSPGNTSGNAYGVSVITTTLKELPAINTLGLIMVRVDFAVGAVLPTHSHPRASEIIYLLQGSLNIFLVDTNNRLLSTRINAGDVFVFPQGNLHIVENAGDTPATVIAVFNSQAPGNAVVPLAMFASNPPIPADVLAKSFKTSVNEVNKIRKKLGAKS